MIKRLYQCFKGTSIKGWMIIGGLLGISALPCPECGTPLILHIWPLALPILVVRALKKRYQDKNSIASDIISSDCPSQN
jgi:hypothetical protein